jgi:hypothetical protein
MTILGEKRMKAVLLLIGALLCTLALTAQEKKVVEPADIADIKTVSDPRISPDGRQVAYVIAAPWSQANRRASIYGSHRQIRQARLDLL